MPTRRVGGNCEKNNHINIVGVHVVNVPLNSVRADVTRLQHTVLRRISGTLADQWPLTELAAEKNVGRVTDAASYESMKERIAHSDWTSKQVSMLSKLDYQVADKGVASVLVELHNQRIFGAGLVVVGTLAYMSGLNEYGAMATAARTQVIDLARRQTLKLGTTVPFLSSTRATHLPFARVPGMPSNEPSTSVKLPGAEGLRLDIRSGTR